MIKRGVEQRLVSLAAGLAFIALAQTVREPAIDTSLSPRWWPEVLGGILALLSIGVGIKELVAPSEPDEDTQPPTRAGAIRVVAVFAAIAAYGVIWYYVAFPVATFALFVALARILGARGWKSLVAFPFICTLVLYVLFGLLLKVPL
jgi:Ca2+/Na+ antiporter